MFCCLLFCRMAMIQTTSCERIKRRQQADRFPPLLQSSPAASACCCSALTLKYNNKDKRIPFCLWSRTQPMRGQCRGFIPHADWFRHCFQNQTKHRVSSWETTLSRKHRTTKMLRIVDVWLNYCSYVLITLQTRLFFVFIHLHVLICSIQFNVLTVID